MTARPTKSFLSVLAAFLFACPALSTAAGQAREGGFLSGLSTRENLRGPGRYIAPNEQTPAYAAPILRKAGRGVYVAVGTERGFMGAAMTPKASHLLLLDSDGAVVKYNRVNIALLKLSKNREDYLHLRLQASAQEWAERARQAGLEPELRSLAAGDAFGWWDSAVRSNSSFALFQRPPPRTGDFAYAGANYLYQERLFRKIHALARAGRIKAHRADLADRGKVARVVAALAHSKAGLSVLDLSNAWSPSYIPEKKIAAIVETFKTAADPVGSLLLLSGGWHGKDSRNRYDSREPKSYASKPIEAWEYMGLRFASLGGKKEVLALIANLQNYDWRLPPGAMWSASFRRGRAA